MGLGRIAIEGDAARLLSMRSISCRDLRDEVAKIRLGDEFIQCRCGIINNMKPAGIIICGGKSRRMGTPKERLDFSGESLLARMVRLVGCETSRVFVCASSAQDLPQLPEGITRVDDDRADCGPMAGLFSGLTAARGHGYTHAFAAAVDLPLLRPALIERMHSLIQDDEDAVIARHEGCRQPLAALYRVNVVEVAAEMMAAQQYSLMGFLDRLRSHEMLEADYADIDPEGQSFLNINRPEDLRLALKLALGRAGQVS